jgi:hypothetical protein
MEKVQGEFRGSRTGLYDRRLPLSHANPTVSPEKGSHPKTSAIYGLSVGECLGSFDPESRSLKTSKGCLFQNAEDFLNESSARFPSAGLLANGKLYLLRKPERRTCENGSGLFVIKTQRRYWRTPDANMERDNRSYENMKNRIDMGKPLNLNDQLNAINKGLLPTPQASDAEHGGPNARDKNGQLHLSAIAARFPTPRASSGNGAGKHGEGGMDLQTAVKLWPTPTAFDWNTSVKSRIEPGNKTYRHNLKEAVQLWPTPKASEATHGSPNQHGSKGDYGLTAAVIHAMIPTPPANDANLVETEPEISGQLNPDWVEALMGYPQGWTDIEKEAGTDADYPAAWLNGTWEDGIPRVVSGMKNRVSRLKCLGNAVVPQIPKLLWELIAEALWD